MSLLMMTPEHPVAGDAFDDVLSDFRNARSYANQLTRMGLVWRPVGSHHCRGLLESVPGPNR
jgi:hypothetical protein